METNIETAAPVTTIAIAIAMTSSTSEMPCWEERGGVMAGGFMRWSLRRDGSGCIGAAEPKLKPRTTEGRAQGPPFVKAARNQPA